MSDYDPMTLDEYVGVLPSEHIAVKELKDLRNCQIFFAILQKECRELRLKLTLVRDMLQEADSYFSPEDGDTERFTDLGKIIRQAVEKLK